MRKFLGLFFVIRIFWLAIIMRRVTNRERVTNIAPIRSMNRDP